MFKYALPIKVDLYKGDILYLPMFWFHSVESSINRTLAITSWYNGNKHKRQTFQKILCGYRHRDASFTCR